MQSPALFRLEPLGHLSFLVVRFDLLDVCFFCCFGFRHRLVIGCLTDFPTHFLTQFPTLLILYLENIVLTYNKQYKIFISLCNS